MDAFVQSEFADYRSIGIGVAVLPGVSAVIPPKNEAKNLAHVFGTIPEWVTEIVLVDGHLVDGTVAVARTLHPAIRLVHQQGGGKGDSLQARDVRELPPVGLAAASDLPASANAAPVEATAD